MKIHSNIPKLQQGGAALPFVSWTPVPDTPYSAAAASTTATKEKKEALKVEDVIPKEMIEALKQRGLPSDMSVFTESIMSLFNDPVYKITGQLNPSTLSTRYLSIVNKMNNIAFNKELYDKSIDRLQQNGGLYDIALSSTGKMIVQNLEDGQIIQVSPDEYYKKLGSYKAISNGDLAHIRAYNPSMAFSSDVFSVLNNGMGQETLQKYINSAISNLESTSNNIEGYTRVQKDRIQNGLSELVNNDTVAAAIVQDGVYKLTHEQQSNVEQAQEALKYLYTSLPMAAKNYLRAKAAEQGIDPDEAIEKILVPFVSSKFKQTKTIKFNYDKQASDANGSSGSSDKSLTPITQIQEGYMGWNSGAKRNFVFNPGSNYEFKTDATHLDALKTLDQKGVVKSGRLDEILSNSTLAAGDKNSIYFGSKKVNQEDLAKIIYKDDGGLNFVRLPYVYGKDGSIMPDFDSIEKIEEIEKTVDPNITPQQKRELYKEAGIENWYGIAEYPEQFEKAGKTAMFMVVNAMAINAEDSNFENPYVEKKDNNYDYYLKYMNRVINENTDKDGKIDLNDGWFSWTRDGIYSGTLYIAANNNPMSPQSIVGEVYTNKSDNYRDNIVKIGNNTIKSSLILPNE